MEKHRSNPLQKLTRRVIGSGKELKAIVSPVHTIEMAEQEEDFTSLPLPDRFQHKVFMTRPASSFLGHTD